jgi:hypothetical protein
MGEVEEDSGKNNGCVIKQPIKGCKDTQCTLFKTQGVCNTRTSCQTFMRALLFRKIVIYFRSITCANQFHVYLLVNNSEYYLNLHE